MGKSRPHAVQVKRAVVKVLVVDDEASILSSTKLLLEAYGFDVVATLEHKDLVGKLLRERPDVLLLDVRMPGLDLDALVRAIRDETGTPRIPIVLFSASSNLIEIHERVASDGYLAKPFRPGELVNALRNALDTPSPYLTQSYAGTYPHSVHAGGTERDE